MRNVQYAALPYRVDDQGALEILLVTSRRTRRWIIPKGWPIKGLQPAMAAAREAFEEAGVLGRVDDTAVGRFSYRKTIEKADRVVDCEVVVFPLRVERQLAEWPEAGQRDLRWLSAETASDMADDDGLKVLIRALSADT